MNILRTAAIAAISFALIGSGLVACKSKKAVPPGSVKVNQPFSGNKFESNSAWFRGTGQGTSVKQNIARSKADLDAKNQLAGQIGTNMRAVTDQYLAQTENNDAANVADKFQSLIREVMNTDLGDLRKIGEETYQDQTSQEFTVHVAYEIKKNAMFRFMKKQAKTSEKVDERTRQQMEEILDKEIEKADAAGE
ncbi:MAG: hypothetical protein IPI00_05160 [Flavobacteriales bacterium]|nr:hypothetical protein [Flavobacteriales bacterium]MBK7239563.1 hypothetical protein [Flavobacteriales bacterium]MBK7296111.1 hypothetical protein [Flavobacteriales bacterium]MBK9535230.1 hypothetical protein [Flavobacteriales bacterium]MBP9137795.1 hypothetical protein [Flavobacteriales bacterium]